MAKLDDDVAGPRPGPTEVSFVDDCFLKIRGTTWWRVCLAEDIRSILVSCIEKTADGYRCSIQIEFRNHDEDIFISDRMLEEAKRLINEWMQFKHANK